MANWRRPCSSRHRATPDAAFRRVALLAAPVALLLVACGHAADDAASTDAAEVARQALCVPAHEGQLRARLQGAIDGELYWAEGTPQCRGGPRPGGDGIRLLYKGNLPGEGPLLVVIGIGPLGAGESARNVPVNLTLVREGTGRFYATLGNDKCAMDEVRQEPAGDPNVYRLTGRGFCVQPARAVGGDDAVLMSRFDVMALVDYR